MQKHILFTFLTP